MRLADYQVPSSLLVLELTETALVINPVKAKKVIEQLHAHGVSLSIDDFGAGFTSFTYLKSCPITEIKLDKAFAQELARFLQCRVDTMHGGVLPDPRHRLYRGRR